MKSTFGLLILLLILMLAHAANATTSFSGVASQAMGGAGRAAVHPLEVAFLNPASFVHVRGYSIGSAYRDFDTADGGSQRNVLFHLSENSDQSMFPLAITYLKTRDINSSYYGEREDIHLTTGQMIVDKLGFGIDVAQYSFTPEVGNEDKEWDLKIGLLFTPNDDWGFGLVFTNLLVTDSAFLKRGVEAGVNYNFSGFFRAALDYTHQLEDNPTDEGVVMVGAEHMIIGEVPVRVGFKSDGPNSQNYYTLGLGWTAPKIAFNYTFEKNVDEDDESGHSVDLRIYF